MLRTLAVSTSLAALALLAPAGSAAPTAAPGDAPTTSEPGTAAHVAHDRAGDTRSARLDLRGVRVTNTDDELRIRLRFPGRERAYDFPLGYVSVYIDTDAERRGPEYGHFMQFWSDYRLARTRGRVELPSRAWSHSPDGRCVADAGLISDPGHQLKWFEYVVVKRDGCFEADAVRVDVDVADEGLKDPYRPHPEPFVDELDGGWTPWVPEAPSAPTEG